MKKLLNKIWIDLIFLIIVIFLLCLIFETELTQKELALFCGIIGGVFTKIYVDLKEWVRRPSLCPDFSFESPACEFASTKNRRVFYLRIKIINTGAQSAENVQVLISDLKKLKNNQWLQEPEFLDCEIIWTHSEESQTKDVLSFLSPKGGRFVDLGYLFPKDKFSVGQYAGEDTMGAEFRFCLKVHPNNRYEYLKPGKYKFNLTLGAKNVGATTWKYQLEFDGNWAPSKNIEMNKVISLKQL